MKAWMIFSRSEWYNMGLILVMFLICRKQDWTTLLMWGLKLRLESNSTPRFLAVGFMNVERGPRLMGLFGLGGGLNKMTSVFELFS